MKNMLACLALWAAPSMAAPDNRIHAKPAEEMLAVGDLSSDFDVFHQQVRNHTAADLPVAVRSMKYLFVGSFLSSHLLDAGYYAANQRKLQALRLDSETIPVNTDWDREGNLEIIGRSVESACKRNQRVVLVGHSRGGVMVHDWYRLAHPRLKGCVEKLVLMQAPLNGTPTSDATLQHWDTPAVQQILGFIIGENWKDEVVRARVKEGYKEFSTMERKTVMAGLPPLTQADLSKIYSFYTSYDKASAWHGDYMESQRKIIQSTGQESDGSVPVDSARLAGSNAIYVNDVDHMNPWIQNPAGIAEALKVGPHPNYNGGDITEALIRTIFLNDFKTPSTISAAAAR